MQKLSNKLLSLLLGGILLTASGCSSIMTGQSSAVSQGSAPLSASASEAEAELSSAVLSMEENMMSSREVLSVPSNDASSSKKSSSVTLSSAKNSSAAKSPAFSSGSSQAPPKDYPSITPISDNIHAVWISQFDLQGVLLSGGVQQEETDFTKLVSRMMGRLKSNGFNTVFIQARPYSDSFYPSQYFPWSRFVTGKYGREAEYDPYSIMVLEARKAGLSVHGWINPMRCMTRAELEQVDSRFPIKKWYLDPQKKKTHIGLCDGRWYYNPAEPEVRQMIADGAKELLSRYQLDGIHIDDYFYASAMTEDFDKVQYRSYQNTGGKLSLSAWRRENISALVKELYQAVKSVDPKAQFGVSPAGNINNNYGYLCADVRKWCGEKGYIDYICPQIYFGLEHQTCPFAETLSQWNEMIEKDTGVYLLVGLSLGKAGLPDAWAGAGKAEWQKNSDVLKRCLLESEKYSNIKGFSLFSYQYLADAVTDIAPDRTKAELENFLPLLKK